MDKENVTNEIKFIDFETGEIFDDKKATERLVEQMKQKDEIIRENELRQRAKRSPYNKWAQLNLDYAEELMHLSLNYPVANSILFFLVMNMDGTNACMVSYEVLMEVTDKSKPTVYRAIKTLDKLGFIRIFKSGTSNIYTINHDVYWKSYGKNKAYSKFPVSVVLSENEQTKKMKKLIRNQIKGQKIKTVDYKANFQVDKNFFDCDYEDED